MVLLSNVNAAEYYVSVTAGSDGNPGSLSQPWQHVQRAVSVLKPGDTCTIRGGTYQEEVSVKGLKGTQESPITFRSYPGEEVVFDGSYLIKGQWSVFKDHIYSTILDADIWQLFVDREMQVNARWPNAFWYDYSVFDYTKWGFSSNVSTYNLNEGTGVMTDNGTKDLGGAGINATDAIAVLNIGQWLTWAGKVTEHEVGGNSFKYSLDPKPRAVHFVPEHCRYYLEDKLEFLDAPSEWHFDQPTKKLYMWLKSSDSPEKHEIRGKNSTYAFTVTDASSWIQLHGLNFFATTVYIRGEFKNNDVDNIKLDTCNFTYPSYSKRMLKSLALPNTTTLYYKNDLTLHAGNFTVQNCVWEYADGQTIIYRGADGHFENNLWQHNDFSCVGDGGLFESGGVRDRFIRNTVHSNGPSVGFSPGAGFAGDRALGLPIGSDVKLNLFYDLKYLQNDGAHMQTQIAAQNGTILEYNWCFDTMKWGLRFDRVNKDSASWGYNGTMRFNVVWGTAGIRLKGDEHCCYNNLAFNSSSYYDIALFGYPGDGVKGENSHTKTNSNIMEHGACGTLKNPPNCPSIPGYYNNNFVGDIFKVLRDPENLDFRPLQNSSFIADFIGPYMQDSMYHGGTYWIPGRREMYVTMPIPPNGTSSAKCDAHLMWLTGYEANSHNVYFGSDYESIVSATTTSSEFKGQMKVPANIMDPGPLEESEWYYWRVDAIPVVSSTIVRGAVWTFKCMK
jgi:hypothetical protein